MPIAILIHDFEAAVARVPILDLRNGYVSHGNLHVPPLGKELLDAVGAISKFADHASAEWQLAQAQPAIVHDQVSLRALRLMFNLRTVPVCAAVYHNKLLGSNELMPLEEFRLLVFETIDKERRRFERLRLRIDPSSVQLLRDPRTRIPEDVRLVVWQRDQGRCAMCGSNKSLEFDHIIPVSKGGANSARNVQLLCVTCNQKKRDSIAPGEAARLTGRSS